MYEFFQNKIFEFNLIGNKFTSQFFSKIEKGLTFKENKMEVIQ